MSNIEIKLCKSPRFIIYDDNHILFNNIYYIKKKQYINILNKYKNFDYIIDNNKEYLYFNEYLYETIPYG